MRAERETTQRRYDEERGALAAFDEPHPFGGQQERQRQRDERGQLTEGVPGERERGQEDGDDRGRDRDVRRNEDLRESPDRERQCHERCQQHGAERDLDPGDRAERRDELMHERRIRAHREPAEPSWIPESERRPQVVIGKELVRRPRHSCSGRSRPVRAGRGSRAPATARTRRGADPSCLGHRLDREHRGCVRLRGERRDALAPPERGQVRVDHAPRRRVAPATRGCAAPARRDETGR